MTAIPGLLQLDRVSRRLGGHQVLREISFTLRRGEVLGLLGVNGAGKSTTLAIIAGALAPDSGKVWIEGRDVAEDVRWSRGRIGWVPENVPLWQELTVTEALDACGRLHNLGRDARRTATERELARLDLRGVAKRLCGQLSLGQKRRLGLAQALLHEPELLVLDEPGNGLDPVQTAQLRELVARLAPDHGIILSSHVLAEVEAMCSRAVILHEGAVRHDAALDVRVDASLGGQRGELDARFRAIARPSEDAAA